MNLISHKNWKTVNMSELAVFSNGKSSPDRFDRGKYPVYGANGVIGYSDQKNSETDSIIIGRVGSYCGSLYFSNQESWVTDNAIICNVRENSDPKFIYYLLTTLNLNSRAAGSGQPLINQSILNSIEVLVPETKGGQREIATILGSLDDKIELLRRENKTLENIAQALFREWFIEFKFPGHEKVKMVGGAPDGWKVGNIYDLMKIQYGFPFKSEFFNENRNGLPLIRIRDLKDGDPSIYTNEVCGEEYIIKRGDIIAGMDAEFRPCIWKGENGVLNQRVCKFISKDESISNYFIYQVIKPHLEFFEKTKGGTTVSHLGKADLDSIELLIPPKNILVSFSDAIDSSHKKLVNNFSEIQTLSRLRDDLLNKIFSE